MSIELMFDVCPETGIGSLMIQRDGDSVKIDLMPDEAADLRNLARTGDLDGAKALLAGIDSRAESALQGVTTEDMAREVK